MGGGADVRWCRDKSEAEGGRDKWRESRREKGKRARGEHPTVWNAAECADASRMARESSPFPDIEHKARTAFGLFIHNHVLLLSNW